MSFVKFWIFGGLVLFVACPCLDSQVAQSSAPVSPADTSKKSEGVPRVPGLSDRLRGFNVGISYLGAHNSAIGWYSVATPAISYTFSPHYSADASASIFFRRQVQNLDPQASLERRLVVDAVDASDTFLSFHAAFAPKSFGDTISAYLTLPTGNASHGLGTGRVTFDFTNHAECYFKHIGFLLDLGAGDSSTLSNSIVTKDYSSLGAMTHFRAGTTFWWRDNYLETAAYEQLPIGSQKIYASFSSTDTATQGIVSVTGASEDNGFTAVLGVPITSKLTALSYYNRSLRHQSDTVSFGLTYVLKSTWKGKWLSLVDRALREAEQEQQ